MDAGLVTIFTNAAEGLGDSVTSVAGVALPVGATILAISIGWRYLKRFVG